MPANSEDQEPNITVYSLQSCAHCKDVKQLLQEHHVPFRTVYVDMLIGEERSLTMRHLKEINPSVSFPTVSMGETTIVGYKKKEIESALDALQISKTR